MTSPVTMSLMGGLGNQLFQLATGLEVAHRAGTSLQLDLAWYRQSLRRTPGGLVLRPFELEGIADELAVLSPTDSVAGELTLHARDVLMRRAARWVNRFASHAYVEVSGDFDPAVLELLPGAHLWGYFASWRYFPTVADRVRDRVLGSPLISTWAREWVDRARRERPVAIHVRRGDYLTLASTYGHVHPIYYRRAVDVLRSMGAMGPVWLFSDEPLEASAWLSDMVDVDRTIEPPPNTRSIDSMVVMASASALAIANSTYSWWAAFLRDGPSRPVVAPRPLWARQGADDGRDLLLPEWVTVDCRETP